MKYFTISITFFLLIHNLCVILIREDDNYINSINPRTVHNGVGEPASEGVTRQQLYDCVIQSLIDLMMMQTGRPKVGRVLSKCVDDAGADGDNNMHFVHTHICIVLHSAPIQLWTIFYLFSLACADVCAARFPERR
jgi:hypothetical protein